MSRLTEKQYQGDYSWPWNCDMEIAQKLGRYEDIGEPDELVKVVRCGECAQYQETMYPSRGECEIAGDVYPNDFCSYGRKKEGV